MLRSIRSNLVAWAALFVALGGSAGAAGVVIHANSVGSAQIKDRSVHVRDLATSARPPSRAKVAQAVTEVLSDPNTGLNITVHGEKGDKGDTGPAGTAGPSGVVGITVREADGPAIVNGDDGGAIAACLDGERVVGGGARFIPDSGTPAGELEATYPSAPDNGWAALYRNTDNGVGHAHAWALCAPAQ